MTRKEVGALPTFFVLVAAVFVTFLARPPIRVLVISVVGATYVFVLLWLNGHYKSKSKSTDQWTCPPYSLN